MSKLIRRCNCDYLCKISDAKKHVHVGDDCFHPNNFHHKIGIKSVKSQTTNDVDFERRYFNWGV